MSKTHSNSSLSSLALLAAVMIPVAAQADMFTYNISGTEGVSTYSQTVNGVTMSFLANPTESSSVYAFGIINSGPANGDLDLSAPGLLVSAFTFKFDAAVQIVSYTVGVIAGPSAGTFSLSAPGSTTSTGNSLTTTGSHSVVGGFSIAANTVGTWSAAIPSGTYPTIRSITVSTVPEPGEWATITAAGCGFAALLLRRRK
jgi:hypothetical protein